jgi:hypothetical protein
MKTYQSKQHGFEIDVPKGWILLQREPAPGPFGYGIGFGCGASGETFNIQFGWTIPEPLAHTEREFRRYAQKNEYTELEFGRITVEGEEHVTARYRMGKREWAEKYLIVLGKTEYAMTANCYDHQVFIEREAVWDTIVRTFRLIKPTKPRKTTTKIERMEKAAFYAERGFRHFNAGRYQKALKEFERGKIVTHEFPWNFLHTSMTLMHMVEIGKIPQDQIPSAIIAAEKNLKMCLLIDPRQQDYIDMMEVIQGYKKRFNV